MDFDSPATQDGVLRKPGTPLSPARRARVLAGLSQEELAVRAGLSRSTVALVETGKRTPRLDTLSAISAALGLDDVRSLFPDRASS